MNTEFTPHSEDRHLTRREKHLLGLFSVAMIIVTVLIAVYMVRNRPTARRQRPPRAAPAVTVSAVRPVDHRVVIQVMGTIEPELEITLTAEVGGEIIAVHPEFLPGGVVEKGDVLVEIDPVSYQARVAAAEASLEQAGLELLQEEGRQIIAEKEWELLGGGDATDLERELALRKPQLRKAQAALRSAEAALRLARKNLADTRVRAPFNAVVRAIHVNAGDKATPQSPLAVLVGTDTYWVKATIPVDRIPWLKFPDSDDPEAGQSLIQTVHGNRRSGTLLRLLSDIEPGGRMARVLIEVPDPLDLENSFGYRLPLLLDEYVRVDVNGRIEKDVIAIPRDALRENDTIWLLNSDDTLDIVPVEVAWRDPDTVLIRGIPPESRLIVSDLSGPVDGMELTLNEIVTLDAGVNPDNGGPGEPGNASGERGR
ncbi:MAG TPA: efflux RND transporter periplasmic adaptor subunit [bacterium]|nr:efflux RND transporter periplasmic adaptor subunit [bacterium]